MDVKANLMEIVKKAAYSSLPSNTEDFHLNMFVMNLLAHGVTVQEWIPVTERLPENIANRVLVVCERSNGVFYAHYEKPFWINLETDKPFISTVTHWMPLPEPQKGE